MIIKNKIRNRNKNFTLPIHIHERYAKLKTHDLFTFYDYWFAKSNIKPCTNINLVREFPFYKNLLKEPTIVRLMRVFKNYAFIQGC